MRTVQSLACLDEADHTVGFLLQLSSFCKEWQFHLPKLLRDVQVSREEGLVVGNAGGSAGAVPVPPQSFSLLPAGEPVLSVPVLHLSAPQQEDAASLPPGPKPGARIGFDNDEHYSIVLLLFSFIT